MCTRLGVLWKDIDDIKVARHAQPSLVISSRSCEMASYLAKCAVVTLAVSGGFHYDTCYKKPSDPTKAHILFIHGFPSSAYDWRHQVEFFADQGYGIIVPDLLGYGGTSKPEDPADYTAEAIGDSLIEVVKQVTKNNHTKVLGVGHDW